MAKIIVNNGRTVHRTVNEGGKNADGTFSRPLVKAYGPAYQIDVPNDEAQFLISRGFARKPEVLKAPEEKEAPEEKPAK